MTPSRLQLALLLSVSAACSSSADPAPATQPAVAAPAAPAAPAPAAQAATGSPETAPLANPVGEEERTRLLTAFRNSQSLKMRVRATMTAPPGAAQQGSITWVVESVPPNTKRMVMTTPMGEMGMVMSGETAWLKPPTSTSWTPVPAAAANRFGQMPSTERDILAAMAAGRASFERAGEETLDGRPTTVYRTRWTDAPSATRQSPHTINGRVWLGSDGRMVKFESDANATNQGHVVMTFEYDDSITITTPPT